jgi:cytidylate kinase
LLVTISGLPGAGTSTVARAVAERLGLDHLDGGTAFRALAAERGLSLAEFGALAEVDDTIDLALDRRLAERATEGDVVLESRLSGWIATNAGLDALRVWIECDARERARRVAGREGADLDAAVAANGAREASEAARYLAYYGIDLADRSVYDLVVDSTAIPPEAVVSAILRRAGVSG